MLGYFPDPYPDELFYSVLARFADRMPCPRMELFANKVFGNSKAFAEIDCPNHLKALCARLPPGHRLTPKNILAAHTIIPFYQPFLRSDRYRALCQEMTRSGARPDEAPAIARFRRQLRDDRSGIFAPVPLAQPRRAPFPQRLGYCPRCLREDQARHGEAYWHRVHQLPGVSVCIEHRTLLAFTDAPQSLQDSCRPYRVARDFVPTLAVETLDLQQPSHVIAWRATRDALSLLNHREVLGPRERVWVLLNAILHGEPIRLNFAEEELNLFANAMTTAFQKKYVSHFSEDYRSRHGRRYPVGSEMIFPHPFLALLYACGISFDDYLEFARKYQSRHRWLLNPQSERPGLTPRAIRPPRLVSATMKPSRFFQNHHRFHFLDRIATHDFGSLLRQRRLSTAHLRWLLRHDRPWLREVVGCVHPRLQTWNWSLLISKVRRDDGFVEPAVCQAISQLFPVENAQPMDRGQNLHLADHPTTLRTTTSGLP